MKKLTAGILASLIGLVSANSAEAAVASTTYVEDRIEALDSEKAYGNDATDSVTYIKSINEQDGIITASEGTLNEVALKGIVEGDGIDFSKDVNGATVITADVIATPGENNLVKVEKVTTENGDVQLQISAEKQTFTDTNTTYAFEDGNALDFAETTVDENGNVVVKADVLYGNGLKLDDAGKLTTDATGAGTVTVSYDENGQMVITGSGHDGNTQYGFTDSETVVFDETTDEAGNVTVTANAYLDKLNVANAGDTAASTDYTSWYSLMRKCTGVDDKGLPTGCVYQWESVVREYSTDTQQ